MPPSSAGWSNGGRRAISCRTDRSALDWAALALRSEIAYSQARGGAPGRHDGFIHIHNKHVPWGGDFNRAVDCAITDQASFERIEAEVKRIHADQGLEPPDRFDLRPPALEVRDWQAFLAGKGYVMHTALFFAAPAKAYSGDEGYSLRRPTDNEYFERHEEQLQKTDYFDEQWFREIIPLEKMFIRTFAPFWLVRGPQLLASLHCAHLGDCSRLFDVEVAEQHRGQGRGKLLLDLIRAEAQKSGSRQVLLQTTEGLRPFYEKAGFAEISRNSVIRRKLP